MNIDLLTELTGEWQGEGVASYPTIDTTPYTEKTIFTLDTEIIHYVQKTWRTNGELLHWESGFIRVRKPDGVIWVNSQNNGRVEVMHAIDLTKDTFTFVSVHFGNDPRMIAANRTIMLDGSTLRYTMDMQATTHESPAVHLEATLRRV